MAHRAEPARNVRARVNGRDELRQVGGGVLQVAVHRNDDVAVRTDETGVHSGMLAEVPLQADGTQLSVAPVEPRQSPPGPVRGTVVDEDDLVGPAEALERGDGLPVDLLDSPLLVVHGDDEGHRRSARRRQIQLGYWDGLDLGHPQQATIGTTTALRSGTLAAFGVEGG
jgi:hypothetical protein